MTEEDVERVFKAEGIIFLSEREIVSVKAFSKLFNSASSNPNYEELVTIDGGRLGYITFFDKCKKEGILK